MVQGCTSDAGKSTLVAALCRWLVRRGVSVAPFKPQNMALNSAVTIDGGEIGRAQAAQAMACRIPPHSDMNPVLLKPNTDVGAQVIIQGHAIGNMDAIDYHAYKATARAAVLESYARLRGRYDAVIVEGAGSPAEINLRANDIANMGFAEAVDCPVILVADIDRGGVFAHLVGTLALLSESEQARVHGFVINRFRGDLALLQSGLDWLEARTGKPVLGVLPYLRGLTVEAEDAISREAEAEARADARQSGAPAGGESQAARRKLRVIAPVTPRISNHTDFDALRVHECVDFSFVGPDDEIPNADLIILPGSKSVRADLDFLRARGWEGALARHLRYGGRVLGICGGFQMLGRQLRDPQGIEGAPGESPGFGWLDMTTTLLREKQLRNVSGTLAWRAQRGEPAQPKQRITGYEIHAGISEGPALARPALVLESGPDGAISPDDQVMGTYVHGIFDSAGACDALLEWAGLDDVSSSYSTTSTRLTLNARREQSLERLADAVDAHLDTNKLLAILNLAA